MTGSEPIDVALWGATQVGKTTALAAYLAQCDGTWISPETETTDARRVLRRMWNLLLQNQIPGGTERDNWYGLRHREGRVVRFRDMRGDYAQDLNEEDAEALRVAAAGMVFVEWLGERGVADLITAGNALQELESKPRVLVITKCECGLNPAEFAECCLNPRDFADRNRTRVPGPLRDILRRFDDAAVFPITVFGWYGEDGLPAHYHDEFAQCVPWRIRPCHVERPFEFLLGNVMKRVAHV